MIIAFIGTDGAGKTTLINETRKILSSKFGKKIIYRHLRPGLLPPISWWFGKKTTGNIQEVDANPHGKKSSGRIGSLLRLCYYGVDYTVGYWYRKTQIKSDEILIFDRYVYDVRIDSKRLRINVSEGVADLFLRLSPKPDLVFCLGGTPDILYARKPETSLKEVSGQVKILREISHENGMHWVNTTQDLELSLLEIQKVLSEQAQLI